MGEIGVKLLDSGDIQLAMLDGSNTVIIGPDDPLHARVRALVVIDGMIMGRRVVTLKTTLMV